MKPRSYLSFKEHGKSQETCKHKSHHNPLVHKLKINTKENKNADTEGEAEGAIGGLHNLKANKKELYPHGSGDQNGSHVANQGQ